MGGSCAGRRDVSRVLPPGPDVVALAERVLTAKQLAVMRLVWAGYGYKSMSERLGQSPWTIRDHHQAARRRIDRALVAEVESVENVR